MQQEGREHSAAPGLAERLCAEAAGAAEPGEEAGDVCVPAPGQAPDPENQVQN